MRDIRTKPGADAFRGLECLPEPDDARPLRGPPPEVAERVRHRLALL